MTTLNFFVMLGYILRICLFFVSESFYTFWILLELNMMITTCFFYTRKLDVNPMRKASFQYFLIQSSSSMGILILCQFIDTPLPAVVANHVLPNLFAIFVCMKMGLFPFHFWIFKMYPHLDYFMVFLLLGPQKIPLILFIFETNRVQRYIAIMGCLFSGVVMMWMSKDVFKLIVSSSVYTVFWLYVVFLFSFKIVVTYFFLYCLYLFYLLKRRSTDFRKNSFFAFQFYIGLPPFSFFFVKIGVLRFLYHELRLQEILVVWGCGFASLLGYMVIMYDLVYRKDALYTFKSTILRALFPVIFIVPICFVW